MSEEHEPNVFAIFAQREYHMDPRSIQIFLAGKEYNGRWSDGWRAKVTWEKQDEMSRHAPVFSIDADHAQQLMDDLWTCGVRPTEGAGSAGAMAATQKHLDDMRRLVFEQLCSAPFTK